jgi:hypothetical protein
MLHLQSSFFRTALAALTGVLCLNVESPAFAGTWKIRFTQGVKPNQMALACESEAMYMDFLREHAWCVSRLRYRGEVVGQPSGATGSVFQWNGQAIGTGHGGEVVRSLALMVDGRTVPLVVDGAVRFRASEDRWEGREIRLLKKSVIGPFTHEAEFHLPASCDRYAVEHRYVVNEEWRQGKFTGYTYVFMQMMPPEFAEWLLRKQDGSVRQGRLTGEAGFVFRDEPGRVIACYAPAKKLGVAYIYPEEYLLHNHILDRGEKDRKFRAALVKRDGYVVGEAFSYRMKIVPFSSDPEVWPAVVSALARQTFEP